MKTSLPALLLVCAATASAGNSGFDLLVKAIEQTYETKPTHIPMMGLANFVVRVTHPQGVSAFRIAVFEDLPASKSDVALPPAASDPTIEVREPAGGLTRIYIEPAGNSAKILVAVIEGNQATVVEAKVSPEILRKTFEHPGQINLILGFGKGGDEDDR